MRMTGSMLTKRILLALGGVFVAAVAAACGGSPARPALGNDIVEHIDVAAESGSFHTPLDSALDPEATTVYFTANGPNGPGVFRVAAGGGDATEVLAGKPFVAPSGIAVGSDGQQIYVADPRAPAGASRAGQIFVIPASGKSATALPGAGGAAPRGLDVVREGGQDTIYFTGIDPADGQPAVFKLPAAGASAPTIVAKGAPLVEPDGITVTKDGVVYVSDRAAAGGNVGSVFKIDGKAITAIVSRVRTGNPAGLALSLDESVLLVSALQPDRDSDQVVLVDLKGMQTGSLTKVIEQNQKAGGVHRARNRNVFSWADSTAGPSLGGRVFVIK